MAESYTGQFLRRALRPAPAQPAAAPRAPDPAQGGLKPGVLGRPQEWSERIRVIGGGLAGCEAAWQIARRGVPVELWEMRPVRGTEAHVTDRLAELVCSNSFRSDDAERNAVGLLHEEMRRADSLVMAAADRHKVPAGQALAVDRTGFADAVQQAIEDEPAIRVRNALKCPVCPTQPTARPSSPPAR